MKKSIYILACAGLMAVSCGEELLETRSSSSSDSETMFSNETYAEAAVMNIYRQFGVDKSYRNRWLVYYGANTDSEWYVSASPDKPTDTKTLIYTYNPTYDDAGSQLNESSVPTRGGSGRATSARTVAASWSNQGRSGATTSSTPRLSMPARR